MFRHMQAKFEVCSSVFARYSLRNLNENFYSSNYPGEKNERDFLGVIKFIQRIFFSSELNRVP